MSLDATLLRQSFTMVMERSPGVMRRFYELLFQRHPETESMFPRGPEGLVKQENMLTNALTAVLARLEDGPWLEKIGRAHV